MLVAIVVLLLVLVFLAVAETALSRGSPSRRPQRSPSEGREVAAGRCCGSSSDPERCINPLLLTVNICQTVQATLTGDRWPTSLFGPAGVVVGVVLNVVVFFVLAEAVPKT